MDGSKREFSCRMCYRMFRDESSLLQHIRAHKVNRTPSNASDSSSSHLSHQHPSHGHFSGDRASRCALCAKNFSSETFLMQHVYAKHRSDGSWPFRCSCPAYFPSVDVLQVHLVEAHHVAESGSRFQTVASTPKRNPFRNPYQAEIPLRKSILPPPSTPASSLSSSQIPSQNSRYRSSNGRLPFEASTTRVKLEEPNHEQVRKPVVSDSGDMLNPLTEMELLKQLRANLLSELEQLRVKPPSAALKTTSLEGGADLESVQTTTPPAKASLSNVSRSSASIRIPTDSTRSRKDSKTPSELVPESGQRKEKSISDSWKSPSSCYMDLERSKCDSSLNSNSKRHSLDWPPRSGSKFKPKFKSDVDSFIEASRAKQKRVTLDFELMGGAGLDLEFSRLPKRQEFDSKPWEFDSKRREIDSEQYVLGSKLKEFDSKPREFDDSNLKELGSKQREFGSKRREFDSEQYVFDSKQREFGSKQSEFDSKKRREVDSEQYVFGSKQREFDSKRREYDSEQHVFESMRNKFKSKPNELYSKFCRSIRHPKTSPPTSRNRSPSDDHCRPSTSRRSLSKREEFERFDSDSEDDKTTIGKVVEQTRPVKKCAKCNRWYPNGRSLKLHQCGSSRYRCADCPERFATHQEMRTHHTNAHKCSERQFRCPNCPRLFPNAKSLSQHVRDKHKQDPRVYRCGHCDQEFSPKAALDKHLWLMVLTQPIGCHRCQRRFDYICAFKHHHCPPAEATPSSSSPASVFSTKSPIRKPSSEEEEMSGNGDQDQQVVDKPSLLKRPKSSTDDDNEVNHGDDANSNRAKKIKTVPREPIIALSSRVLKLLQDSHTLSQVIVAPSVITSNSSSEPNSETTLDRAVRETVDFLLNQVVSQLEQTGSDSNFESSSSLSLNPEPSPAPPPLAQLMLDLDDVSQEIKAPDLGPKMGESKKSRSCHFQWGTSPFKKMFHKFRNIL